MAAQLTFLELVLLYFHQRLKGKATYREYWGIYEQYFSGWTEHPTRRAISDWHESVASTPGRANKGLGFLRAMYNWAIKKDLWFAENPASRMDRYLIRPRKRTLDEREVVTIMAKQDELYPPFRVLLLMLLTTGCRLSEALTAKWNDLNLERGVWVKPHTKTGDGQRMPIPRQTCQAIARLPRRPGNAYVFMGNYEHHLSPSAVEKMWQKTRVQWGMSDVRLHDFRRTLQNRLRRQGVHIYVIKAILNHHTKDVTESHYNLVDFDEQAEALQTHADRLYGGSNGHVNPFTAPLPHVGLCTVDAEPPCAPGHA